MASTYRRYLIYFVKEHLAFRLAEFNALTKKYNCHFQLVSSIEEASRNPYVVVESSDIDSLRKSIASSVLAKGLYEIWAESCVSHEDLYDKVRACSYFKENTFTSSDESFRINIESFGIKASQEYKVKTIENMHFLADFKGDIRLKDPKQVFCLFEYHGDNPNIALINSRPERLFFGRWLTDGNRCIIKNFSLKTRKFIANTSMDPTLSLIMANMANIQQNSLVYDPFVGSGSLLIGAAYNGAYVIGSDINFLLLHGRSRPSRQGKKTRDADENVRSNLAQYHLEHRYLDVLVSDASKSPFAPSFVIDSIITDPPYGIRESTERVGTDKQNPLPVEAYSQHYPSKIGYKMRDILKDLLTFASRHLAMGGRLLYWLPVCREISTIENHIPKHKCLRLVSFSEQPLTLHLSRVMIVMEKMTNVEQVDIIGNGENLCDIPEILDTNFRDKYLNISTLTIMN